MESFFQYEYDEQIEANLAFLFLFFRFRNSFRTSNAGESTDGEFGCACQVRVKVQVPESGLKPASGKLRLSPQPRHSSSLPLTHCYMCRLVDSLSLVHNVTN